MISRQATGVPLVEELVAYAEENGIEDLDLDEIVHDLADEQASHAYNAGEGEQGSDEAAYDEFHEAASYEASEINNNGLEDQIGYMVLLVGAAWTRDQLSSIAASLQSTL